MNTLPVSLVPLCAWKVLVHCQYLPTGNENTLKFANLATAELTTDTVQ